MKSMIQNQIKPFLIHGLMPTLLVMAMLSLGAASSALAGGHDEDRAGIFPPQSHPYGQSYGEWVVDWWQWVLSIPADRNPLLDTTGEFAGESQHGPVWFVAGTFGDSVERSYTVPQGKALFVPVYVWTFGAGTFDCEPSVPGVPCVVCELQELAKTSTEAAEVLEVTIDGVPVQNLRRYEAASPKAFRVFYPVNSVVNAAFDVDLPGGIYRPQVADGYWLMLQPLAKGTHELRIHVVAPGTEFDVIHHITVTRDGHDRDDDRGSDRDDHDAGRH